jgi:hypothetical protein
MTGGTWSGSSNFGLSLTLAGNITVSGTVGYKLGTITYSSGTITTTGSTLQITDNCTLNTNPVAWGIIYFSASGKTYTVNSLLLATELKWGDASGTFAGTAGFTVGTLSGSGIPTSASRTFTLTQTNTYTVTSAITCAGDATHLRVLASSHATLLVPFVFSGSTQTHDYVTTTRVDSSGGNLIVDPHWVDNDPTHPTLNWATTAPGGTAPTMWLFS